VNDTVSAECQNMTGAQFALHVMMSFDLDICRCGIFKDEYVVCGGGIDTIETFFNEDLLLLMDLDTMIWSGRGWRGMNNNEKHERRMETKDRIRKYIAR